MKTTDLESLAAIANHEHACGEEATRKGLLHYRTAGAALLEAKKQVGHGNFRTWIAANVCFSYRSAREYMQLARDGGAKWRRAASMRDALDHSAARVAELVEAEVEAEAEGTRYSLLTTITVTSDTDPSELEELIRTGQVHWVLKNNRNKTLAVVRVEAVDSLERLRGKRGRRHASAGGRR